MEDLQGATHNINKQHLWRLLCEGQIYSTGRAINQDKAPASVALVYDKIHCKSAGKVDIEAQMHKKTDVHTMHSFISDDVCKKES